MLINQPNQRNVLAISSIKIQPTYYHRLSASPSLLTGLGLHLTPPQCPEGNIKLPAARFTQKLHQPLQKIPDHDNYSTYGVGATRIHSPSKRSKEGDEGIRCTTMQTIKWPNLMIEVGYSELLSQLRLDAE